MRPTTVILRHSKPPGRHLVRLLVCVLLAAASLHSAHGQGIIDKRFQMTVQPRFGVARGHAPLALNVTLSWSAAELVEGRLQLDWYVDSTRLGRHVSSDLALSDSILQFDLMLPPVILPHDEAIFSVQAKFLSTSGTIYDLDVHDVALQPDWRRILLVAVCTTAGPPVGMAGERTPPTSPTSSLARQFRLEPFFENRFTRRELLVDDTEVEPDDVPVDPLQLTAFDLFVIPADSFPSLKPRQLEALLAWVRAGGSLCVFVDSAVSNRHVEWLNQLNGRDPTDAAFVQTADGELVATSDDDARLSQHRLDFGRVVTVVDDAELSESQWQQAVLFLWKVREDRSRAAAGEQLWRVDLPPLESNYALPSPLEPQRIWQEADLTKLLLPESVRGLPLASVSVVLAVFLLVIAPGDYLLLGWLKRRRWTWVLFPAVSLLFTGYMMWLARQHLGQTSYEHTITVVDVGQDGQPVRTSRFEMLYLASNRRTAAQLEHQVMVPLDPVVDRLVRRMLEPRAPREYEQPWMFSGRIPQHYSIERDIQQWSPRMARVTAFGSQEVPMPAADTPVIRVKYAHDRTERLQDGPAIPPQVLTLAENITRRPPLGFFSVVSQISPTCGGNWEDLSLLDESDPQTSVLVDIANPAEGQYVILRRLHREPE